jgi:hypothetical protein
MKNLIYSFVFLLFATSYVKTFGQVAQQKNIIISTRIPDNFSSRYNVGIEFFFKPKDPKFISDNFSVGFNTGITSTTIAGQKISGYDLSLEGNWYSEILLPKKWNEYAGVKVSYGNFINKSDGNSRTNFNFIGVSTGIQPIIKKVIAIKLSTDFGYIKNGLSNLLTSQTTNTYNYTGFAVLFNLGIGVKF